MQEIFELFKVDSTFLIISYSFGSLLSLKIASVLEKFGKTGRILLIDGAPKLLKRIVAEQLPENFTIEDVRKMILVIAIQVSYQTYDGKIVKAVLDEKSWDDHIKKFIELYPGEIPYSEEYVTNMLNALVQRTVIASNLSLDDYPKIRKSSCILIRPTEQTVSDMEKDYGLSKYFTTVVNVKFLEGSHATVLDNSKLDDLINNF